MYLDSLSVIVPDYASAIDFFCGTLGFDLVEDVPQGDKRWVRVRPPGGQTSIILARAATPRQARAIGTQGGGRVWLFLRTEDFARDHARLCAAGIAFEGTPRHEAYGTVAVFHDPFGNRWDLLGPPAEPDFSGGG